MQHHSFFRNLLPFNNLYNPTIAGVKREEISMNMSAIKY